jgi:hypothetical protein
MLVEGETAGDPMTKRKWVRSSLRWLSKALDWRGYEVGPMTVRRLLRQRDYSLKANRKEYTGPAHPDRDRQFRYIERVKRLFLVHGYPMISVDTKKKELIGNFKNRGRSWCQQAE